MPLNEITPPDSTSPDSSGERPGSGLERRSLFKRAGAGVAGVAAMSALSGGALLGSSQSADAATAITDADIFNFALNLEYLESQYYLIGATGKGLPANLTTGSVGTLGAVTGGSMVPFASDAFASYAQRIAVDELAHVTFIRTVLGSAAVAQPAINLQTSFTTLAMAAGLIGAGQTFNPFADEISFLLGAYIFEDVGVSAYGGAAALISNKTYLTAAAGILGTEAYHSGAIRTLLSDIGGGAATNAISKLRATLSGAADDVGTLLQATGYTNAYNFVNNDSNGLTWRRTTSQVLNVVYGGTAGGGLFFPAGLNGTIK